MYDFFLQAAKAAKAAASGAAAAPLAAAAAPGAPAAAQAAAAPSSRPDGGAMPPPPPRPAQVRPAPLRLDAEGREIDEFGNVVVRKPEDTVSTLKVGVLYRRAAHLSDLPPSNIHAVYMTEDVRR